jgi:3-oxoacyl-[acyl-carrier protein] reductase
VRLDDRPAIVTGAGAGIGAACALALAARGADIVVGYASSRDAAEETAARCRDLGVKAQAVAADVADDEACRGVAAAAQEMTGRLDILVNNAGATRFVAHDDLDGLSGEDFVALYRINVVGAYQMIRAAAPAMRSAGRGTVVNMASMAGLFGSGSSSAYACSKGALITLTRSMARALAPEIRVNAVCPGFVGTRWFADRLGPEGYAEKLRRIEEITPLAHAGEPDEIAAAVTFLCAEGGALITGETLLMDAGAHLDLMLIRG